MAHTQDATGGRAADAGHQDRLLRYVETLALVFSESGIPRMPARVFAFVLADDAEEYTAGELCTALGVSPAAISGAVRYLVRAGLLGKERSPGARSDVYRIDDDDVWSRIYAQQIPTLDRYEAAAAQGAETLGLDRPGGRRLEETRTFFAFLRADLPQVVARWQEHRATLDIHTER